MSNTFRRPLGQVSNWHPATNKFTPVTARSVYNPHGLTLRHTVLGSTLTNVSGNGTTVTYTCRNSFVVGDRVTIINVVPSSYNLTNVAVASRSDTQFTVTNSATGTFVQRGNVFSHFVIPSDITWVYVVLAGGGGRENGWSGGGAGGVAWGWTTAQNRFIINAGAPEWSNDYGGFSRYGHIMAGGGGTGGFPGWLGGGAGGAGGSGSANMWGMPGGVGSNTTGGAVPDAAAGGGGSWAPFKGGNGISGGGGQASGNALILAGDGGNGMAGGGGGGSTWVSGVITGTGGTGIGIDGTVYVGGVGSGFSGGGGAGIAGNGVNAASGGRGGLGGGGSGGVSNGGGIGIGYIFY